MLPDQSSQSPHQRTNSSKKVVRFFPDLDIKAENARSDRGSEQRKQQRERKRKHRIERQRKMDDLQTKLDFLADPANVDIIMAAFGSNALTRADLDAFLRSLRIPGRYAPPAMLEDGNLDPEGIRENLVRMQEHNGSWRVQNFDHDYVIFLERISDQIGSVMASLAGGYDPDGSLDERDHDGQDGMNIASDGTRSVHPSDSSGDEDVQMGGSSVGGESGYCASGEDDSDASKQP